MRLNTFNLIFIPQIVSAFLSPPFGGKTNKTNKTHVLCCSNFVRNHITCEVFAECDEMCRPNYIHV